MEDFSRIDQQLDAWVDAHHAEIIEKTQALLRIPSVEGPAAPGAPFGVETRQALDYALSVAAEHGLATKNLEGYAAHAQWQGPGVAEDAPIVGVLAHVDVVPAGDGWSSPPFAAEIVNGKIVARGAMGLIAREALQARRNEFLATTTNPIDSQIMGMSGRAYLLRELGRGLQMDINKIVPDPDRLKALSMAQATQQQPGAPGAPGPGGPPQGGTPPQGAELDPSGRPMSDQPQPR